MRSSSACPAPERPPSSRTRCARLDGEDAHPCLRTATRTGPAFSRTPPSSHRSACVRAVLRARGARPHSRPDLGACIAQVRALASAGQTVLLSAYTHSALDNVLLKLDEMGVPLLRLGEQLSRIHPRLHKHTVEARAAAEIVQPRDAAERGSREAAEIRLHRRGRQELPLRVSYLGGLTAASRRHLCGRPSSSRRMSRSSCRRCCATAGW